MPFHPFMFRSLVAIFLCSCLGSGPQKSALDGSHASVLDSQEFDSGSATAVEEERFVSEIIAGVGIGPVQLGETYGQLVDEIGSPDSSFEYFRVIFAVWFELGIEVVFSSGEEAILMDDSIVVSVGTKLSEGYSGPVIPGMNRTEAEAVIGRCADVVDGVHCYHPTGLYLGFDSLDSIHTVAIHPAYTIRSQPPEMGFAMEGVQ